MASAREMYKESRKSPTRDDPLELSGVQQKILKKLTEEHEELKRIKGRKPKSKSRSYSLSDLASGDVKLEDAIKNTEFNKRQGTVRSIDKKDPKKTAKEIESVLKGSGMAKGGKVKKKQKVRGAGIARKGVRPAKMY